MKEIEKELQKRLKKLKTIKNKKKKSDYYYSILSFLAAYRESYDLVKKYKLYPAPNYVDMTFVNKMLKTCGISFIKL